MKLRNLSASVALIATAAISGQAMALPVTTAPDVVVNISGASAQQKTLGDLLSSFCTSGSLTQYRDDDGAKVGKKWRSYYCEFDATNPNVPVSLAGQNVLINNRAAGGSIWGVVPVAREWSVEYMNIFGGSCTTTGSGIETCTWKTAGSTRAGGLVAFAAGTDGQECPFVPYAAGTSVYATTAGGADIFAASGTTASNTVCLKSDGGVSDLEPAQFSASANFPGFPGGPLSTSEVASMATASEYAVIFGFSIGDNAYKQLQVAQGLATYADIANDPVVTGDAARPSLPKTAIVSLLSGKLNTLEQVDSSITPPPGGLPNFMSVCRRVVGSGTQAAQNVFFMGNPCLGGSQLDMVSDEVIGGPGFINATTYVQNNSSSGDVEQCHNNSEDGTLLGLPIHSIGFNSISKDETTELYKFVSIDGVAPNVANAIAGKYPHWFEQTIQWPAATSGAELAVLETVRDSSGDPAVMTAAGLAGVAALPQNGWDWKTTSPTMRGSRGNNSCSPILLESD